MKNLLFILTLVLVLKPMTSLASDMDMVAGEYDAEPFVVAEFGEETRNTGQLYRSGDIDMTMSIVNGKLKMKDIENNIDYSLDLNSSAEQDLGAGYLKYWKSKKRSGQWSQLIERITISDIHSRGVAHELEGHINFYLKIKLGQGAITGKVRTTGRLYVGDANRTYDVGGANGSYETKNDTVRSLYGYVNGKIEILSIESGNTLVNSAVRGLLEYILSKSGPMGNQGGARLTPSDKNIR